MVFVMHVVLKDHYLALSSQGKTILGDPFMDLSSDHCVFLTLCPSLEAHKGLNKAQCLFWESNEPIYKVPHSYEMFLSIPTINLTVQGQPLEPQL